MKQEREDWLSAALVAALNARGWLIGAVVLLAVLVVWGIAEWLMGGRLEDLARLGYPGIFLLTLLGSGSIFVPVPGLLSVFAAGTVWNPALVGVVGALGGATGELTGYALGVASADLLSAHKAPRWWSWLLRWFNRCAFFAIFIMASVPNPVFDAVGLLAGASRYPVGRFWLACLLGNSLKFLSAAYLGDVARWWLLA